MFGTNIYYMAEVIFNFNQDNQQYGLHQFGVFPYIKRIYVSIKLFIIQ